MAWGIVEYNYQPMIGVRLAKVFQECLETGAVQPRQVKAKALPRRGIDRGIEIGPFVGALHDVRRAKPLGTVALLVPVDQPKACLVKCQNLQWLLLGMLLAFSP